LIVEHRRGTALLFPGALLEIADDEAMVLVQDGIGVPASVDEIAKETR
jgi:hypothetical protein